MPHSVTRRDFLRISALGLASAVLTGCQKPRRWVTLEPYVRPPEEQLAGVATWYASTCRQCPAGCGIIVRTMNGRALKIEGNPEHPLNEGRLCPRGQAGLQVLYNPDRLHGPVQQGERGGRQFEAVSWEAALNTLYSKVSQAGSKVAILGRTTMSGHLYDLFQRFAAAVGASPPVLFDLYSVLSGRQLSEDVDRSLFGAASLPVYDLARAELILSFGADLFGAGISPVYYGKGYGAFRSKPLGERGYLIQLEPRMSTTGAVADLWQSILPASEAMVAQALVQIIADQARGPADWVSRARMWAPGVDVSSIATASGLSVSALESLAQRFVSASQPLAIPGPALAGQANALEAAAAVQILNLVSGVVGNGGLLALSNDPPVSNLVKSPEASYAEMQALTDRMLNGDVQMVLIHEANPVQSLPGVVGFVEALSHVPFVVSFSPVVDETSAWADMILPDRTYLESWGYEVVSPDNGSSIVGSQQPVVTPLYDTRATGDVLLTVAQGILAAKTALPWNDEVTFLQEMVGSLPEGAPQTAGAGGQDQEVRWARFLQHGGWWPATRSSGRTVSSTPPRAIRVSPPSFQGDPQEFPYYLHLYMSSLLSDGRGANQPWLQGVPDPMTTIAWQTWVELNPTTATDLGVQDGDLVVVISPYGEVEVPVYVYPAIRPDTVAIAVGQGHSDYGRYAQSRGADAMRLVGSFLDRRGRSDGGGLSWATVRVKIVPTGQSVKVAMFENKVGVTEGFINEAFPGE